MPTTYRKTARRSGQSSISLSKKSYRVVGTKRKTENDEDSLTREMNRLGLAKNKRFNENNAYGVREIPVSDPQKYARQFTHPSSRPENPPYTVSQLTNGTYECTCMDYAIRVKRRHNKDSCKHIDNVKSIT